MPSTATASTTTSTRQFSVTLEGPGGFTQAINFKISLYDPYKVKIGDLISREGNFFDGGYRGNGLFENSAYIDHTAGDGFNSILAWLGNKHMTEDPFWSLSSPGVGLKDVQGNVYHGIAIPVNIDRLYRKTEPNGEYYYDEDGNNNFILDSGNLPGSWVNSDDRKDLLRSTSDKHSAIFNTAVHVYTNEGRGKSWEIRPANFFVDVYNRYPGESSGMAHTWNTVYWDGCWHEADPAWDASLTDNGEREYFDLTTEEMNKDHKREAGGLSELIPVAGADSSNGLR